MENLKLVDKNLKILNDDVKVSSLTGYASIDKPQKKWYKWEEYKDLEPNYTNIYDYFFEVAKDYDWPLLEYYGRKYTLNDIKEEVDDKIKKLTAMGIKPNDTVSFIFLDVPEAIFFGLALAKMGAISNSMKFDESPENIAYKTRLADSKYTFIQEVPFIVDNVIKSLEIGNPSREIITVPVTEEMPKVAVLNMLYEESKNNGLKDKSPFKTLREMQKVFAQTLAEKKGLKERLAVRPNFISYSEWKKKYKGDAMDTITGGALNTCYIIYTGGTTGTSKGVELTNKNLIASAHSFLHSDMDFDKGKTSMNILPPSISYYFNATYNLLCSGVKVNLISKFTPSEYPSLIKKNRPNIFMAGPILLKEIVKADILDDTSFMTVPISGGDKLDLVEEREFNDYVKAHGGDAIVRQGYGMTECSAAATYINRKASLLGSIGIPLMYVDVAIFDYVEYKDFDASKLEEKKYHEVGEICISGPTIMKGYRKDSEATNQVLRLHKDGKIWLHTEDLGYMDEEGRVFHCGRAKRMLTRSGEKVWPSSIENTVKMDQNVADCCCVKLKDEVEREVPVCHIILKDNVDNKEEVIENLDKKIEMALGTICVPKYYVITDNIPITPANNKVDFMKLENTDILDTNNYSINGKIITEKVKRKVLN